jgi:hypothetical protein
LSWEFHYVLETTKKHIVAGISGTTGMFQVKHGKNVVVGIGLATKLD